MHNVNLPNSYFAIHDSEKVLDTTVGGLLRSVSESDPDKLALVEVDIAGEIGRRWTY